MASIIEKVGEIHIAVVKDKELKNGALADALSKLAVEAIMEGFGKPAWLKYMSIFADNTDQLKLLTERQGNPEPDYLPKVRAYIVANAVCAAGTNTATTNGITKEQKAMLVASVNNVTGAGTTAVTRPAEITSLLPA
ncbi:MAG: hypothetical protein ABW208_15685 [Pyrinomonadaceae bacterium]